MTALLPLQHDDVWLALPASYVQEILGSRTWVPIPGAPRAMPGVMAWRGRAVALLDLGALSGGTPLAAGRERARTVVVTLGASTLAIPVDTVHEVQDIDEDRLRAPHATRQRFADREVDLRGLPVPVLDLPAIMRAVSPKEGA
jgi:purine-binding chemotaxis protein CheW